MATTARREKVEYSFTPEERSRDLELLVKGLNEYGNMSIPEAISYIEEHNTSVWGYGGVAYELGKKSLAFFCKFFLQDIFIPSPTNKARNLASFHYDMWDLTERLIYKDEFDKLGMTIFRGGAKTTIEDVGVSIWCHCYKHSIYTLVLGATDMDATGFLFQIRTILEENKRILETFGYLVNAREKKCNANELELDNDTKIHALGSGTSIRGKKYKNIRPTLIISDDYQTRDDILTDAAREKKWSTWEEDVKFTGDAAVYRDGRKVSKATKIIVLGTILHGDCYMSRIMRSNDYVKLNVPVTQENVDKTFEDPLWRQFKDLYLDRYTNEIKRRQNAAEFYKEHESEMKFETAWEDKYTSLDLGFMYIDNPRSFKQELMNDAKSISDPFFKSMRTMPRKEIEKEHFIKTILVVDPASGGGKKNDYCVFAVMSESENSFIYIRNGEMAKFNAVLAFDKYCQHFIDYLISYPDITHIVVEKNTFNGADVNTINQLIQKDDRLKNRDITFINEIQKRNKENKIGTIVGDVNNGRIIFAEEDEDFNAQIMEYCGEQYTLHDDAPDVTSEGVIRLSEIEFVHNVEIMSKRDFLEAQNEY